MSLRHRARRACPDSRRASGPPRLLSHVVRGAALLALLLVPVMAAPVSAQQQIPRPRLLRRSAQALPQDEAGVYEPGESNLPDEASGGYALNPEGNEVIEIILNGGGGETRLQGYITRRGDGPSDQGAPLTYFFSHTTVSASEITFITRQVHGAWWSFTGSIDRGTARMSTQKGFYFLNGTLTEHFDNGQHQVQRISLPLLPEGRLQ
jgi:hypothetical protein